MARAGAIVVHEQGGAYFAGRAVDYVILIALLPFSLLAIPAFLSTADYAIGRDRTAMRLAAIPFIAFLFVATFSSLYLFRANSPYSLYVHECRDKGRCSPAALLQGLADTMRFRLAVDRGNDVWARNSYDDTGTVANAIDVIDRYAATHAKVTVLLGENRSYQMLSDIALLYADRGQTWPTSFTFKRRTRAGLGRTHLGDAGDLATGDLIVVRRDEVKSGESRERHPEAGTV